MQHMAEVQKKPKGEHLGRVTIDIFNGAHNTQYAHIWRYGFYRKDVAEADKRDGDVIIESGGFYFLCR